MTRLVWIKKGCLDRSHQTLTDSYCSVPWRPNLRLTGLLFLYETSVLWLSRLHFITLNRSGAAVWTQLCVITWSIESNMDSVYTPVTSPAAPLRLLIFNLQLSLLSLRNSSLPTLTQAFMTEAPRQSGDQLDAACAGFNPFRLYLRTWGCIGSRRRGNRDGTGSWMSPACWSSRRRGGIGPADTRLRLNGQREKDKDEDEHHVWRGFSCSNTNGH